MTRARWRRVDDAELDEVVTRLERWPAPAGGAVRHLLILATVEREGPSVLRVAETDRGWAACLVQAGHLLAPAGDPEVIRLAGPPTRRWRIMVGDAAASDALLARWGPDPRLIVHVQRFQTADPAAVPPPEQLPDPGLRVAQRGDAPGLAELAVDLHRDDGYGPDPGAPGLRAYRQRMEVAVRAGSVLTVGPVGDPLLKIERAVDSPRYGVQLAGICVRRHLRGTGLGAAAVAAAVRGALADHPGRPVTLHVRSANLPALRAYARAGFVDREEWRLVVRT